MHKALKKCYILVFLSGLCGHELKMKGDYMDVCFLSGLSGHERVDSDIGEAKLFLSGLCGHER